jgi:hypothetical protein
MSPWPKQGELNDYEYFEQYSYKYLVQICVAQMRRARLEILKNEGGVMKKDYEGLQAQLGYAQMAYDRVVEHLEEMTKHRDEWREECKQYAHEALSTPVTADRLDWECGRAYGEGCTCGGACENND